MAKQKIRLELTWIGKANRMLLERNEPWAKARPLVGGFLERISVIAFGKYD